MFGNEVSIFDAINITISSMAIVFLTLIVISIVLSFFKHIFKQPVKATAPAKPQVNKVEKVVEEDDEEEKVEVALAASIMAGEGKINPNLHVKRIERIK